MAEPGSQPLFTIERLTDPSPVQLQQLADLLIDCVQGGASVSFMLPLAAATALAFWRGVADELAAGRRALLVARDEHGITGTVQLVLAQPDNQPHRADLAKMLVHRRARRQGIGAALMNAAQQLALACGKPLLVLDTASDEAARLYERHGWQRCGRIPGYALLPAGGLCDTVIYYRWLAPPAAPA